MERAAHLLGDGSLSGKEVAWACGYANPSYFIRSFRRHHGSTPQAWRLQHTGLPGATPADSGQTTATLQSSQSTS
jgi:AraC-like DNA-binding protein